MHDGEAKSNLRVCSANVDTYVAEGKTGGPETKEGMQLDKERKGSGVLRDGRTWRVEVRDKGM
jgi:hypothetical protein